MASVRKVHPHIFFVCVLEADVYFYRAMVAAHDFCMYFGL